jgi:3-keto-disaccharide hydrolase
MIPQGSNSGIYFQSRYEIQIFDSWGKKTPSSGDCGAIYERWKDGRGFEGHPPRVNASRPPGEWQSFDVMFRAPRFNSKGEKIANARFIKVVHNGQTIHEKVEVTGPTRASTFNDEKPAGPLMLQGDHGPVAYRNLRLRPIQTKD